MGYYASIICECFMRLKSPKRLQRARSTLKHAMAPSTKYHNTFTVDCIYTTRAEHSSDNNYYELHDASVSSAGMQSLVHHMCNTVEYCKVDNLAYYKSMQLKRERSLL